MYVDSALLLARGEVKTQRHNEEQLAVWPLLLGIQAGVRNTLKGFYSSTRRHVDFLPRSRHAERKRRNKFTSWAVPVETMLQVRFILYKSIEKIWPHPIRMIRKQYAPRRKNLPFGAICLLHSLPHQSLPYSSETRGRNN